MEGMISFVGIIALVFGVLQIILFFKLWGMTNDINAIKEKYLSTDNNAVQLVAERDGLFEVGALVVNVKTEKQMRVKEINVQTGKYSCYTNGGLVYEGDFSESELKQFK